MVKKEDAAKLAQQMMENRKNIRNIGIVAHIDHGKSTLSDTIVAAGGLISQDLAGKQLFMDYYELEQERGITINAANVSVVYNYADEDYLINLIDTPGHVDFGGDVIRAMRAVDGVIIVVDAVEGVMPQTETVIRQALRENCKPVLFVNKVDRLINELKVSEKEMQERFIKTIAKVNLLIQKNCPAKFGDTWIPKIEEGSVVFGSALYKWAISVPQMKQTGVTFSDVYKFCKEGNQKELSTKSPLHKAVLEMIVKHLPNPLVAQKYRIPEIWKGDLESEVAKGMMACDQSKDLAMMVTDVQIDPHAGEIATGRIYSGSMQRGDKARLIGGKKEILIQQVGVYMGPDRIPMDKVFAGNIAFLTGVRDIYTGETIARSDIQPFESFKSSVEPVMTISIEAQKPQELPKLIEVLRQITKEDPNVIAAINQETGEHLISGMGELHLDVTKYRIEVDHGVKINVGNPIVVYNETITKESPELTGKSPNKHNLFKIMVEPMSEEMCEKLKDSGLKGKLKKDDDNVKTKLLEIGFERDDAKKAWYVSNNCIMFDNTKGIQALHEIRELVCQGFDDAMKEGPLTKEKCHGIIVRLIDAKLHEDAIHRGPAQILPTMSRTLYACILSADPILLEPKQKLFINIPQDYMGSVTKELGQRRTQISEMTTEGDSTIIIAIAPVKELIGFSSAIRSATQGRAIWTAEFFGYSPLPRELLKLTIAEVRKRNGLPEEIKSAAYFLE